MANYCHWQSNYWITLKRKVSNGWWMVSHLNGKEQRAKANMTLESFRKRADFTSMPQCKWKMDPPAIWALTSPSATAVRMISALRRACYRKCFEGTGRRVTKTSTRKMILIHVIHVIHVIRVARISSNNFWLSVCVCVDQACTCSVMFGLKTPSRGLSMGLETDQNSVCRYVMGVGQNNPEEAEMMLYQKL